jgi:hypothetical protein
MSREEDAIRTTTKAIAATVRDVPPLELAPAPGELWSPGRGPRRARRARRGESGRRSLPWLAPLAAAAVVVAVAVSLVLVRGPQNVGVVPQPALTDAGPGGVPRYYVAVDPAAGPGPANGLLMGDTVTGDTLPVLPPPQMSFESVTAAADDRTFFVFATETGGSRTTGLFFMLVLAPGTDHVVSYGSTAIAQQSGVVASALSASGKYLAVAEDGPAKGEQRVTVFSVATGRPLRTWSTTDRLATWTLPSSQGNPLTWIDGDRAIAFTTYGETAQTLRVRTLNVAAPLRGGNLMGDGQLLAGSQLIWSTSGSTAGQCNFIPPLVSADGNTVTCVMTEARPLPAGDFQWTITWRAYQASALAPASGKYAVAYEVTRREPGNSTGTMGALWTSQSGSALIGEWGIAPAPKAMASWLQASAIPGSSGSGTSATMALALGGVPASALQVGVMSHGTFTPLGLPQQILPLTPQAIAW